MSEKPILFSGPMVRAILAGQKTQTRRVVSRQVAADLDGFLHEQMDIRIAARGCPYNADRLWVRETWRPVSASYEGECVRVRWAADDAEAMRVTSFSTAERMLRVIDKYPGQWRPSIYCERWASRLLLRVESIRVERLNDISEEDARAEGAIFAAKDAGREMLPESSAEPARSAFRALWESINGKRPGCSWDANPWVWVVTFSRATP